MPATERELICTLERSDLPLKERRGSLGALRRTATDASVGILAQHLEHEDSQCQVAAVFALRRLKTDEATEALIQSLARDPWPGLGFAVHSLREIGDPRARPPLIRLLEDRRSELSGSDRHAIVIALSAMPHREEVPVLTEMLHDSSWSVRRSAAATLGMIRAPESAEALTAAMGTLPFWRRRPVARALRRRSYESI